MNVGTDEKQETGKLETQKESVDKIREELALKESENKTRLHGYPYDSSLRFQRKEHFYE